MMKIKIAVVVVALSSAVFGAEPASEIRLTNGATFTRAKIVSINGEQVTIVHSGGSVTVPADQLDLEIVARARIALEDAHAQRAVRAEVAKAKAEETKAADERAASERKNLALAEAAAREGRLKNAKNEKPAAVDPAKKIMALKAAFPAKNQGSARVFIPRSGRNDKPYIVSSTLAQLPNGSSYVATTTRQNAGPGRIDSIQYDAPPGDVWSWYQGMFQTTTLQALPKTLEMVEKRIAEDTQKFQFLAGGSSVSVAAQSQHSLYWIKYTLRPYIAEWRALLK